MGKTVLKDVKIRNVPPKDTLTYLKEACRVVDDYLERRENIPDYPNTHIYANRELNVTFLLYETKTLIVCRIQTEVDLNGT